MRARSLHTTHKGSHHEVRSPPTQLWLKPGGQEEAFQPVLSSFNTSHLASIKQRQANLGQMLKQAHNGTTGIIQDCPRQTRMYGHCTLGLWWCPDSQWCVKVIRFSVASSWGSDVKSTVPWWACSVLPPQASGPPLSVVS
jgi:hypothetical protein